MNTDRICSTARCGTATSDVHLVSVHTHVICGAVPREAMGGGMRLWHPKWFSRYTFGLPCRAAAQFMCVCVGGGACARGNINSVSSTHGSHVAFGDSAPQDFSRPFRFGASSRSRTLASHAARSAAVWQCSSALLLLSVVHLKDPDLKWSWWMEMMQKKRDGLIDPDIPGYMLCKYRNEPEQRWMENRRDREQHSAFSDSLQQHQEMFW
eukprot:925608-Amphidinium_carterae.2